MSRNIPVLLVTADVVPEAWEQTVLTVYDKGLPIRTEYDKPGDLPSLDATVMVEVRTPAAEPRIHKNFPGGPAELEVYRQEVVEGIHDHWIDPAAGKWTYTYHERLFDYRPTDDLRAPGVRRPLPAVNQIEKMIEKLAEVPWSRRAQAITWMPNCDPDTDDPPCLQRLWARLTPVEGEAAETWALNMNAHWRSRDLYKAWFMNVFAITDLQARMAGEIAERSNRHVVVGRYVDIVDSLHIYGSYRTPQFEEEIEKMKRTDWRDRAWETELIEPMLAEAREKLKQDVDYFAKGTS